LHPAPHRLSSHPPSNKSPGERAMRIMIINGPNLNLLGVREPHIYGSTTLEAIRASCEAFAAFAGATLAFHQSNHEGVLVDLIQSARTDADALIINPAGYSFTSIAMYDAMKIFDGPIYEVHISNIHARDELHHHSKLSGAAKGVICGLGPYGYIVAMQAAARWLGKLPATLPTPIREGPQ
jgi:3-dehydroquinate dehydratase II